MDHTPLITVEGAFEYFLGLLLLIAAGFTVYVVAVYLGLAPDPTNIFPASASPSGDLPFSIADPATPGAG